MSWDSSNWKVNAVQQIMSWDESSAKYRMHGAAAIRGTCASRSPRPSWVLGRPKCPLDVKFLAGPAGRQFAITLSRYAISLAKVLDRFLKRGDVRRNESDQT